MRQISLGFTWGGANIVLGEALVDAGILKAEAGNLQLVWGGGAPLPVVDPVDARHGEARHVAVQLQRVALLVRVVSTQVQWEFILTEGFSPARVSLTQQPTRPAAKRSLSRSCLLSLSFSSFSQDIKRLQVRVFTVKQPKQDRSRRVHYYEETWPNSSPS